MDFCPVVCVNHTTQTRPPRPSPRRYIQIPRRISPLCLCTCDDKFLKKAKKINGIGTNAVSILELLKEVEDEYQGNGIE